MKAVRDNGPTLDALRLGAFARNLLMPNECVTPIRREGRTQGIFSLRIFVIFCGYIPAFPNRGLKHRAAAEPPRFKKKEGRFKIRWNPRMT